MKKKIMVKDKKDKYKIMCKYKHPSLQKYHNKDFDNNYLNLNNN
jgi:hypothetical protein